MTTPYPSPRRMNEWDDVSGANCDLSELLVATGCRRPVA
jgi:hypothetical protein